MHVDEHTIDLAGLPVFYRIAPASGTPPVFLHGLPTSSDDWEAVLASTGGLAPDLLGFGRSAKGGNLDLTVPALASCVLALLEHLELPRVSLVGHQWGALVARALAAAAPERVERLVLIAPVLRETRLTRAWRRPLLGELIMGATTKAMLSRALRRGAATPEAWPRARLDAVWDQFDQGTQRAILRLYRSPVPAPAPSRPTLVLRGAEDPWSEPDPAGTEIAGAGHWPWIDRRQETLAALTAFLGTS